MTNTFGCHWKLSEETKEKMRKPKSLSHRESIRMARLLEKNPNWKGGKILLTADGYIRLLKHGHHNANSRGYVLEHRFVMSEYLGRPLDKDEYVHHKNSDRSDNRIENLELIKGRSAHARKHIYSTNKNWIYIKHGVTCPHCLKEISMEQITKVA